MHPHTRWLELDLKHRGARRITTFCRRGDVKANQLDDDQTNRVILSSSSADVKGFQYQSEALRQNLQLAEEGLPQLVSKTRHTLATARRCCESYREGFPASSLLASKSLPMVSAAFLGAETPQRLRITTLKISDTLLLDGLDRRDLFFASRRLWKSTFGATLKRPCTRRILSL